MATYDEIRFELDNLRAELEKACHEAENSILQVAGIGSTDIKVERTFPLVIDICDLQVGDRITIPMGENVYTATAVDECDGEIYLLDHLTIPNCLLGSILSLRSSYRRGSEPA